MLKNISVQGKLLLWFRFSPYVVAVVCGVVGLDIQLNSGDSELTYRTVNLPQQRGLASTAVIKKDELAKKGKISARTLTSTDSKATYMDCQSSSELIPRVVLKANRKRDFLTQLEVILVSKTGKSSTFQAKESVDGQSLRQQGLDNKKLLIVGNSNQTILENGLPQNQTEISLFESIDPTDDLTCLSVEHRTGHRFEKPGLPVIKNRQLRNELRYQKFSGTLYHQDQVVRLTCFSPMIPRESSCGSSADSGPIRDEIISAL